MGTDLGKPIAVTVGEPAGIGLDIIIILLSKSFDELPPLALLCDIEHIRNRADILGLSLPEPNAKFQLIELQSRLYAKPACPDERDAAGVVEAISSAVKMVRVGDARALVTLPINKKSLYDAGFQYPGHTEFLGALAEDWGALNTKPVMMLAGPELRAVPVTVHIPLKDVPQNLTQELIVETIQLTHHDLMHRFGISSPRIAVAGLNPHAGENGALGTEDADIIEPAITELRENGIDCYGPLPADTMFHKAARKQYDAAVCMYHDQALIPAKALAFDETVNVTLGLPFVRTSPDHGTAYDIAGTGKANPTSTLAAIKMADDMTRRTVK